MKRFEPTCYRYKTDLEFEADEFNARHEAGLKGEDPDKVKVRVTKDIQCFVETYYMNATPENPKKGRRMLKMRFHKGREYHIPARDFALILQTVEFEVRDVRGS